MRYAVALIAFGLCAGAAHKEGHVNRYSVMEILAGIVFALGVITA